MDASLTIDGKAFTRAKKYNRELGTLQNTLDMYRSLQTPPSSLTKEENEMVNAATKAALDKQRAQEVMSPSLINSKFEGQAARYSQVMKRRNIKTGSTVSRAAQSTSMSYRSSRALELHKFNTQAHNAKNN